MQDYGFSFVAVTAPRSFADGTDSLRSVAALNGTDSLAGDDDAGESTSRRVGYDAVIDEIGSALRARGSASRYSRVAPSSSTVDRECVALAVDEATAYQPTTSPRVGAS